MVCERPSEFLLVSSLQCVIPKVYSTICDFCWPFWQHNSTFNAPLRRGLNIIGTWWNNWIHPRPFLNYKLTSLTTQTPSAKASVVSTYHTIPGITLTTLRPVIIPIWRIEKRQVPFDFGEILITPKVNLKTIFPQTGHSKHTDNSPMGM